jgi:L-amino acid ligase
MQEALTKQRIATSQYFVASNKNEAMECAKKLGTWPVVIKPIASVGGEGVTFCYSNQDIISAFEKVTQVENFLGLNNESVLIQSLICGEEYMVNTVSVDGEHFLSDIWFCKKDIINQNIVFDYGKLITYEASATHQLLPYVFRALDALEIKHGAAHNEVTVTSTGPILMETGARVMGSIHPDWISEAIGRNQLDLTIDSYIEPKKYEHFSEAYKIRKHLSVKFIIPYVSGTIKEIKYLDYIEKLKSFYKLNLHSKVGSQINLAYELFAVPGTIVLMHEDEATVMNDYEQICNLEKTMFVV